ncbi:MAG: histidine kinase [Candidatus Nanopelagicales bacterium]
MDLATAQRRLQTNPQEAALRLDEARGQAAEALEELRSLSRGFAPADRGGPRPDRGSGVISRA